MEYYTQQNRCPMYVLCFEREKIVNIAQDLKINIYVALALLNKYV